MAHDADVFVNCPFDQDFKPLFEAIVFTVAACGYNLRCALEDDDSTDIRFKKLCRIIEESPKSIHDLSRIQLNDEGYPRFNMPFELGLTVGAKVFGGRKHKSKSALVLISTQFRLPVYLSDLGGNDPHAHNDDPGKVIDIVRRYLHVSPDGALLPGAQHIKEALSNFQRELPNLAKKFNVKAAEVDVFRDQRTYAHILAAHLVNSPVL